MGIYEGLPHHAPRQPRPPGVAPRQYRVPRGESWDDVNKRARRMLLRLGGTFVAAQAPRPPASRPGRVTPEPLSAGDGRLRVLVVTHGGFIMEAVNAARGADGKATPFAENGAFNTAVYKFELSREPSRDRLCCRILAANDASHLARFRESADIDLRDDDLMPAPLCSAEPWWRDDDGAC